MDIDETLRNGFRQAPFIAHLGIELESLAAGCCEASLAIQPWHLQQTRVVHAGVIATLADHCAGAAASTDLPAGEFVVTAEYKINLLRGARGETLRCRAEVLKPGRRLAVVEAQVWSETAGRTELVAKLNATMAVVTQR
jgi:uncharacterized protein (TIGR00369 family)